MAVFAPCDDPQGLLDSIYSLIEENTIQTWEFDKDGDLTHSPNQWDQKAWFHPFVERSRLVFGVIAQNGGISSATYGVYHGRLMEMLITHFEDRLDKVTATANGVEYDQL